MNYILLVIAAHLLKNAAQPAVGSPSSRVDLQAVSRTAELIKRLNALDHSQLMPSYLGDLRRNLISPTNDTYNNATTMANDTSSSSELDGLDVYDQLTKVLLKINHEGIPNTTYTYTTRTTTPYRGIYKPNTDKHQIVRSRRFMKSRSTSSSSSSSESLERRQGNYSEKAPMTGSQKKQKTRLRYRIDADSKETDAEVNDKKEFTTVEPNGKPDDTIVDQPDENDKQGESKTTFNNSRKIGDDIVSLEKKRTDDLPEQKDYTVTNIVNWNQQRPKNGNYRPRQKNPSRYEASEERPKQKRHSYENQQRQKLKKNEWDDWKPPTPRDVPVRKPIRSPVRQREEYTHNRPRGGRDYDYGRPKKRDRGGSGNPLRTAIPYRGSRNKYVDNKDRYY